jgi:rhodanese-related sulfurtransferase
MKRGYKSLVADAASRIKTYSTEDAIDRFDDERVVFVDVRDLPERVRYGSIPGAIHASRGMLEFHIDPESPFFMREFGENKEYVFHCAIGARGALAAQRATEMGLEKVANVDGGFTAWKDLGGPIDDPNPSM